MTTGLRGFRAALDSFLNEASATSLTSAFARRVSEALDAWAEASGGWGQAIVARRVLELSGVKLTPAASRGVATFVRLSESVSSQESARQSSQWCWPSNQPKLSRCSRCCRSCRMPTLHS